MTAQAQGRRVVECACCGVTGPNAGRGLVRNCYERHSQARDLHTFPLLRGQRTRDDVLDEWQRLAQDAPTDMTKREIARRMGMSHKALDQALLRARKRGDPRAVAAPWKPPW